MRGASWEWGEQALAQQRLSAPQNLPPQVVGFQNIPLDLHYPPTSIGPLGVRGASWERGEGPLVQEKWWAPQKLAPQVVRTPKYTIWCPLPTSSTWSIGSEGSEGSKPLAQQRLSAPKNLPPQVVGSPKHTPRSPLTPYLPLASPEPPWALPRASGCLGSLQKPLAALGLQSDSGALLPLPLSLPLALPGPFLGPQEALGAFRSLWQPCLQTQGSCSPLAPLGPSWGLRKPCEPSETLGLQSRLRALLPLPPCSLSLPFAPEPIWAPGTFLGPQKALEAFSSLGSSVRLRGLAPLTPSCSISLPEPLGSS